MSGLEIVVVVATGLAVVMLLIPATRRRTPMLLGVAVAAGLLNAAPVVLGSGRWQLFPVAASALVVVVLSLWRFCRRGRVSRALTGITAGLAALALVVGMALAVLMPINFLPQPTGSYGIGTTVLEVTDPARPEIFTADPTDRRTLPVQVWYPTAADATGPVEPYVRDPNTFAAILDYAKLPRFLLAYLAEAPTHAHTDRPPATGRFPVVFFLTGNMAYRQSNLVQVEDLVSHGYVVVGMDQPGVSSSALLSDGRHIRYAGSTTVKPLVDQSITPVSSSSGRTAIHLAERLAALPPLSRASEFVAGTWPHVPVHALPCRCAFFWCSIGCCEPERESDRGGRRGARSLRRAGRFGIPIRRNSSSHPVPSGP